MRVRTVYILRRSGNADLFAFCLSSVSTNVPCGPTSRLPLSPMSAAAEPKPAPVPAEESIVKTEEGTEPQNPLTQKFTEAEWKAVKELRVRIRRPWSPVHGPTLTARYPPFCLPEPRTPPHTVSTPEHLRQSLPG